MRESVRAYFANPFYDPNQLRNSYYIFFSPKIGQSRAKYFSNEEFVDIYRGVKFKTEET